MVNQNEPPKVIKVLPNEKSCADCLHEGGHLCIHKNRLVMQDTDNKLICYTVRHPPLSRSQTRYRCGDTC